MQVVDHRQQRLGPDDVAIKPPPWLPEVMLHALAALRLQARQPVRRVLLEVLHGLPADRLLEPAEEVGVVVLAVARPDDQVDVIGHEDVRPHGVVQFLPGCVDGVGQPLATAILGEQREAVVAGAGQLVGVTGIVVAARPVAAGAVVHATSPRAISGEGDGTSRLSRWGAGRVHSAPTGASSRWSSSPGHPAARPAAPVEPIVMRKVCFIHACGTIFKNLSGRGRPESCCK